MNWETAVFFCFINQPYLLKILIDWIILDTKDYLLLELKA